MERILFWVSLISALGSGLIAGAFFVFSVAVMGSLRRLPASDGMAAMQSINVVILNPAFLGVFVGTALTSAVVAILALLNWNASGSGYLLAGALFYVIGTFLVTVIFNVPLNNALAAADAASAEGKAVWENYLTVWTNWNHVRTVASLTSLPMFILGISR